MRISTGAGGRKPSRPVGPSSQLNFLNTGLTGRPIR